MKIRDFMLYPSFEFIEDRGQYLPVIRLPENYLEIIQKFYEQRRVEDLEQYAKVIETEFLKSKLEIKLRWDKIQGLTNISVGPSGGLDLNHISSTPSFQEHNLGTSTGIAAGFIAMKYIQELLKSI